MKTIMKSLSKNDLPALLENRNGNNAYITVYKNEWKSDDKTKEGTSRRKNSKTVGKIDLETRLITFYEPFIEEYPFLRDVLVYKRGTGKNCKYEFKYNDEKENEQFLNRSSKTMKLHVGATYALGQIVARTPIGRPLQKTFPNYNRDKKILSLVYFLVLNRDN